MVTCAYSISCLLYVHPYLTSGFIIQRESFNFYLMTAWCHRVQSFRASCLFIIRFSANHLSSVSLGEELRSQWSHSLHLAYFAELPSPLRLSLPGLEKNTRRFDHCKTFQVCFCCRIKNSNLI